MDIERWPIVTRARLVEAFRPGGEPASEGPFRTLRSHAWVTSGVGVVTRRSSRASGRVTVFSVLNLDAARLAREGNRSGAATLARAAKALETSPRFRGVRELLSGKPSKTVLEAVEGKTREPDWPELYAALRPLAEVTAEVRRPPASGVEWISGTVAEQDETSFVMLSPDGVRTALPRWLALAAFRDEVGDCLSVTQDRLAENQMLVNALPALMASGTSHRSHYGRRTSLRRISKADAARIGKHAAPLRILVPVTLGA